MKIFQLRATAFIGIIIIITANFSFGLLWTIILIFFVYVGIIMAKFGEIGNYEKDEPSLDKYLRIMTGAIAGMLVFLTTFLCFSAFSHGGIQALAVVTVGGIAACICKRRI